MPYKLSDDGRAVLVKRGRKWELYKRYYGRGAKLKALKLLRALVIHVEGQHRG